MEQSSFQDEQTVRHQFDSLCKLALKSEVINYEKHMAYRQKLIAEALQTLTEKKRNVVLLSYFMDMSDADIAREMNLVRSTINEHRRRSLELMRKNMEESANEKK